MDVLSGHRDSIRHWDPGACPLASTRISHTVATTHTKYHVPSVSLPSVAKYKDSLLWINMHNSSLPLRMLMSLSRCCVHWGSIWTYS
eukprot:4171446-Ditylum_brightwellii.AAC.1